MLTPLAHINTHHTLTLYAKPDKSRTIGTKCLSESLLKEYGQKPERVMVFLSPSCAVTHSGWQDDIMTIAGRHASCVWVISMSNFSLLFFRRFRRQDVRHGNAVQQCNGLQLSGMFLPELDQWRDIRVLEALKGKMRRMRSVQVEEVRVQLMRVSDALCTDGAFTLEERHPVTVTARFYYSRNNFPVLLHFFFLHFFFSIS